MAAKMLAIASLVLALCAVGTDAQAPAPAPSGASALFDWGRPCTLLGNSSQSQITGPNNAACTPCGSGATATPEPTCGFKPVTYRVGQAISIFYHSSVHHLFIGPTKCSFATEICPNATSTAVSPATPCTYTFRTPGSFYISDKSSSNPAVEDGSYCSDFSASLPVTVSTAS